MGMGMGMGVGVGAGGEENLHGKVWTPLLSSQSPTDSNLFYSLGKQKEAFFLFPAQFSWFFARLDSEVNASKAPPSPVVLPDSTLHYISAA